MNGHAPRYAIVLSDLRAEVIRVLVEHPRELSAAVLTQRLRHRFPWYQWFGN
jgi:Fe2+ or Zn2+ uptake regulation protein